MVLEILPFILQGGADRLVRVNVTLATIDNGDIAQSKRDNTTSKNVYDVRSSIPSCAVRILQALHILHSHQIDLRQHTNSPLSLRIHLTRKFETVGVGQIRVRGSDGKDDTCWLRDVLE